MKTTHTLTLHSYASKGMFRPVNFTAIQPTDLQISFTTLPVYSSELRCAITAPPARLSTHFPLATFNLLKVDYHPYCLKTSGDILSMNSITDL